MPTDGGRRELWDSIYYIDTKCTCGNIVRCWIIEENTLLMIKSFSQQCICGREVKVELTFIHDEGKIRRN